MRPAGFKQRCLFTIKWAAILNTGARLPRKVFQLLWFGNPSLLPPDPKLEGQIWPIADIDPIEIGAVRDVLALEEVVIEDVAAGKVEGCLRVMLTCTPAVRR